MVNELQLIPYPAKTLQPQAKPAVQPRVFKK